MKRLLLAALCALPSFVAAESYVTPVATARVKDRVYSTTTSFTNSGSLDVSCEAIYAIPTGGTLRAKYELAAGKTIVEDDTLIEAGAVGTLRFVCTGPAAIVARVLTSTDDGKSFDVGRIFPAVTEADSISAGTTTSIKTTTDLLMMEIAGRRTPFEITVRDRLGATAGAKKYDLRPFGQELINLSKILPALLEVTIEIKVAKDAGSLVVSRPTIDPTLVAMTEGRPQRFERATTLAAPHVVAASFKAAPFREPITGLVYMRDRWYDPSTGSFLTSDPEAFGDSSNLYAYCGGDPVNCSDPTGRAAAVSKGGAIVGKRPNGTAYRFGPGYGAQSIQRRIEVQLALERDDDLSDSDVRDIMARAGLQYGATSFPCAPGQLCLRAAAPRRASDYAAGTALQVTNTVNALLGPVNQVNGQLPFPTPDPENERQRSAYEFTGNVLSTTMLASAFAGLVPRGALTGQVVGEAYNISTSSMSAAEREAVLEYARRTNVWLGDAGAQFVQPTKGPLRRAASAAARRERLRAERAASPYEGQVGHVPDTAISNQAEPPAGWLDMPGTSNQCCGAGLGSRIGKPIRVITVDGKVPR
jgi:RHS repeat-associated protein